MELQTRLCALAASSQRREKGLPRSCDHNGEAPYTRRIPHREFALYTDVFGAHKALASSTCPLCSQCWHAVMTVLLIAHVHPSLLLGRHLQVSHFIMLLFFGLLQADILVVVHSRPKKRTKSSGSWPRRPSRTDPSHSGSDSGQGTRSGPPIQRALLQAIQLHKARLLMLKSHS